MNSDVVMICPGLAPGSGGLADYSLRVSQKMSASANLRFVLPAGDANAEEIPQSQPVAIIERNSASLLAALPSRGGAVLLQYSAYGYDRVGYPRWLLRGLREWKGRSQGRLVVMFHEIWTFWPVLNKNYFVQRLHRGEIRRLLEDVDHAFTSTASQAEHLRRLSSRAIEVLPVGSNVRPDPEPGDERSAGVAVLFGLAGTRRRALLEMRTELEALARSNLIRKIITVGGGTSPNESNAENDLLCGLPLADGFEQRGSIGEEAISHLLHTGCFGISGQDELSLTKSGSFMAYAAHGMNVIARCGGAARSEPACWLTTPEELLSGVTPDELQMRANKLRDWQNRTASWPQIAAQFGRALEPTGSVAAVPK